MTLTVTLRDVERSFGLRPPGRHVKNRPTQPTFDDRELRVTRRDVEQAAAELLEVDVVRAGVLAARYWLVRARGAA